jgi:hypothetical protein
MILLLSIDWSIRPYPAIDKIASQYQNITLWRPINGIKQFTELIIAAMDVCYDCNLVAHAMTS